MLFKFTLYQQAVYDFLTKNIEQENWNKKKTENLQFKEKEKLKLKKKKRS